MEYEQVFKTVAVVIIAVIAYFSLFGYWNTAYTATVGSTAQSTYQHVQGLNQTLFSTSTLIGNNTQLNSGSGFVSAIADLSGRALSIITSIPTLITLVPALMNDAATIFEIPQMYVNIAVWTFTIVFGLTLAYLLLIGARRL